MIIGYTLALFINSLIVLGLGVFMFSRKGYRGGPTIGFLMLALTIWAAAGSLEMFTTGFYTKILLSKISYIGIVSVGPLFLLFALRYSQKDKLLEPPFQLIYWLLPVFSLVMVWTNEQHELAWPAFHKVPYGDWLLLIYDHGPVVYLIAGYSYLFLTAGVVILLTRAYKLPEIYRRQTLLFAISMIIPLIGNFLYIFKLVPLQGYDFAPFFFTISFLVIFLSVTRFKFMDVLPIARDTLFRSLNDSIVLVDAKNRIIDFNESIEKFLGQLPVIGLPLVNYFEDWENYLPEIESTQSLKTEIVHTQGNQKKWWLMNVQSIKNKSGILSGYIIVFQDINDQKRNEEKIKGSENKLRELIAVKDTFFNILAHDLRNPFHAILGFSEMLHNDYESLSEVERKQYISNIFQSAGNTYKLITNLLDWSRLQTGRMEFQPEPIRLEEIIREEMEIAEGTAKNKRIHFDLNIDAGLVVLADLNMLQSIIRNILSNAIKFSYPGGGVQIQAKLASSKKILISISDKGVGMSADQVGFLFRLDRKMTNKGTENEEGTGIGLILTKEFVDRNNGNIWLDSNPGFGSTVYFTLPVAN